MTCRPECEKINRSSTTRQPDGRHVVHLSFTQYPPILEKSKGVSLRHLRQLENRFKNSAELHSEYYNVMQDYLDFGHMY